MRTEEIKRRLLDLEQKAGVEPSRCIVRFSDGSEHETTLIEWLDHATEWKMIRITQGKEISPLLCSLYSLSLDSEDDAVRDRAVVNMRLMIEEAGGIR